MKWRSLEESSLEINIRPLREILAERKELIAKYVPAETQAVHTRAVAELQKERLAPNILPVGSKLPTLQLQITTGRMSVRLTCWQREGSCSALSAAAGARSAWRRRRQ